MEEWRVIPGFPDYEVSTLGRIKSNHPNVKKKASGGILKPHIAKAGGYLTVNLFNDGKYKTIPVHRAVALAFIPNPENKRSVDHINKIRTDNNITNLRWATASEQAANTTRNRVYPSIRQVWIVNLSKDEKHQFASEEEAKAFLFSQIDTAPLNSSI